MPLDEQVGGGVKVMWDRSHVIEVFVCSNVLLGQLT